MTVAIVELKRLLIAAEQYLQGSCTIQDLHGRATELAAVSHFFQGHRSISELAQEWIAAIDCRWNECNHVSSPLSESEFRAWLEGQLLRLGSAEA